MQLFSLNQTPQPNVIQVCEKLCIYQPKKVRCSWKLNSQTLSKSEVTALPLQADLNKQLKLYKHWLTSLLPKNASQTPINLESIFFPFTLVHANS